MRKSTAREAFTLLELMLVMALLVIIGGLSFPLAKSMIMDARLSAAGDMVRARVADCRANAMEQGRPWRIGYLPGSQVIQLAPEDAADWDSEEKEPIKKENVMRAVLPRDVVFVENTDPGADAAAPAGRWKIIGVYLADGSARDDATAYFGYPDTLPMRVRVRGLTGAVIVETPVEAKKDKQQ